MITRAIARPVAGTLLDSAYRIFEELYRHSSDRHISYRDAFGTEWNNADNIIGGRLAGVVFMMELYAVTGELNVKIQVEQELNIVENITGDHFTMNHSLFFGRSGLGHCYLEWYKITGDSAYLQKALSLAKKYFYDKPFRCRIADNAALYDGFSGILLFATILYSHTHEEWLVGFIEKLAFTLVHKANACEVGFFWGGATDHFKRNIGVAPGSSGIAWVLHQLFLVFGHPVFSQLRDQALENEDLRMQYAAAVTSSTAPTLKTYSFGYGVAGLALTRMFCDETKNLEKYWKAVEQAIQPSNDMDICSGLPGIGLALVESFKLSGTAHHYELAVSLANKLADDLSHAHVGYFLLRVYGADQKKPGCFFLPEAELNAHMPALPETSLLHPKNTVLQQTLFRNAFPSSFLFMRDNCRIQPGIPVMEFTNGWLNKAEQYLQSYLIAEVEEDEALLQRRSLFQIQRDRFRHKIIAANMVRYEDETKEVQTISQMLREDSLLQHKLVISPKIATLDNGFVLPLDKKYSVPEFGQIIALYGVETYHYRVNAIDTLEDKSPAAGKIIIDRFIEPKLAQTAHDEVVQFLLSQNEDVLELLRSRPILPSAPPAQNNDELIAQISQYIRNVITNELMIGVLQLAD